MTGRIRRRAEAGFTLVELLIALTLLGLVSVVLFGGLRFGTRAWEAGNVQAESLAQVQAVQALLRRRIAQAMPPGAGTVTGVITGGSTAGAGIGDAGAADGRAAFAGEPTALHFVAAVPSRVGVGGIYGFDLTVIEDGESARLELSWHLFRPDEPDRIDAPEPGLGGHRVLIDGIESAAFAYYGTPTRDQQADWHDRWEADSTLPSLIAVEVAFPDGDRRRWPLLQVAPKLAATTPNG